MAWLMVKYARENLLVAMAEAGLVISGAWRWIEIIFLFHGVLIMCTAMAAQGRDWQAAAKSPLTCLSSRFQGENGFPYLMLLVCLPAFWASLIAGWCIRNL